MDTTDDPMISSLLRMWATGNRPFVIVAENWLLGIVDSAFKPGYPSNLRRTTMSQLPLFSLPLWSVTDLTRYLRDLLESDEILQDLWVQGEISNLSRPGSGHLYFTLKDSTSALKCVMWRNAAARLPFVPRDGQAVEVHGNISLYEAAGQYQLYADLIRPAGEGALFQEFLRLKARLEAEGLFNPERKRPIPRWPQRIGVVTSPTGAAVRDILDTIRRRYPLVEVILAPTAVQGDEAPTGIIAALKSLNERIHPDVILLARGGGSIEDLWAFNDERVARAIAASVAPVISGVGHETDFTIADFVSDLRAPTPTAAAERATPNRADLGIAVNDVRSRILRAIQTRLFSGRTSLERAQGNLTLRSPIRRILSDQQRLDEFWRHISTLLAHRLSLQRARISMMDKSLSTLNPHSILQRGYALVIQPDGSLVRSIQQVQPGNELKVQVSDGSFPVQVQGQEAGKG
jgi:exodeoxyribonuclease VII large subunit